MTPEMESYVSDLQSEVTKLRAQLAAANEALSTAVEACNEFRADAAEWQARSLEWNRSYVAERNRSHALEAERDAARGQRDENAVALGELGIISLAEAKALATVTAERDELQQKYESISDELNRLSNEHDVDVLTFERDAARGQASEAGGLIDALMSELSLSTEVLKDANHERDKWQEEAYTLHESLAAANAAADSYRGQAARAEAAIEAIVSNVWPGQSAESQTDNWMRIEDALTGAGYTAEWLQARQSVADAEAVPPDRVALAAALHELDETRGVLDHALEWADWLARQDCYTPIGKAHWPDEARALLRQPFSDGG